MKHVQHQNVTCQLLQRLAENAWDEHDMDRLLMLSQVVDAHMLEAIRRELGKEMAI